MRQNINLEVKVSPTSAIERCNKQYINRYGRTGCKPSCVND